MGRANMKIKKFLTLNNVVVAITLLVIIISGIYTHQKLLYMIPVCFSLIVMIVQAEVNRFGYLLGCINLCVYSVVYFLMGLYASALSALFFSLPIQLMILLNWKRKAYGKATVFKKMSAKMRIISVLALVLGFFISQYLLTLFGSDYAMLDTAASLTGVVTNILCMCTYMEYAYLGFLHVFLTIALNVQVTLQNPAHVTYLINSVFAIYCATVTLINVRKIYIEQRKKQR